MRDHVRKSPFWSAVSIISIAIILILIWFRKGMMMGSGESALPFYNPNILFEISHRAWGVAVTGFSSSITVPAAPFYLIVSAFKGFGVSNVILQACTFLLILVASSLSVYYLTFIMMENKLEHLPARSCAILAGLFYILNPFVMVNVWNRFLYSYMFFYALVPLALLLYIKGLKTRNLRYAFYFNSACLMFAYAFTGLPNIITFWLVILSYFIFHVVTNLRKHFEISYTAKFSLATLSLCLLLNTWWIIHLLGTSGYFWEIKGYPTQIMSPENNLAMLQGSSEVLGVLSNVFRLIHPVFFKNMKPVWGPIYSTSFFETISFLIPILPFSSVLFKPKSKVVVYFASLSVWSFFLTKGTAPPLGEVFEWAFIHFRPLQVYRGCFEKFGMILPLGYAPLFGLGVGSLYCWIKKHIHHSSIFNTSGYHNVKRLTSKILVASLCILVLGVYVWPMWNGYVFTSGIPPANNPKIGDYVSVPEYYTEAKQWLERQNGDSRIIVLPIGGIGITYNWTYGYAGVELADQLFNRPSIYISCIPIVDNLVERLDKMLLNTTGLWKAMALLNAKYLVVRYDINYEIRNMRSPEEIKRVLNDSESVEHIESVRSFGKLDFYELDDEYFLPRIYTTNQFTFANDIDEMLFSITPNDNFDPRNTIVFLRSQPSVNNTKFLESLKTDQLHKPNIIFEKVDPTKYVVHVKDATHPFFLVFSETYHPQWRSYYGDIGWIQALSAKPIPEKHHLIVNGYANAWYIDKAGDYTITLYYQPQSLIVLGSIISVGTFLVCMACLIYDLRKNPHEKMENIFGVIKGQTPRNL